MSFDGKSVLTSEKTQRTKNLVGEVSVEDEKDKDGNKPAKAYVITQKDCKLVVKRLKKDEITSKALEEWSAIFKKVKAEKGTGYEVVHSAKGFSMDDFMRRKVKSMNKNFDPSERRSIGERAFVLKWSENQIQFLVRYNTESLRRYRGNLFVKKGKNYYFISNKKKSDGRKQFEDGWNNRKRYNGRDAGNWNDRNAFRGQGGYNQRRQQYGYDNWNPGDRFGRDDRRFNNGYWNRNGPNRGGQYGGGQNRGGQFGREQYRRDQPNGNTGGLNKKIMSSLGRILDGVNRNKTQGNQVVGPQMVPQMAPVGGPQVLYMPGGRVPYQNFYY